MCTHINIYIYMCISLYVHHLESKFGNSHVLVYHGPSLSQIWELHHLLKHYGVYVYKSLHESFALPNNQSLLYIGLSIRLSIRILQLSLHTGLSKLSTSLGWPFASEGLPPCHVINLWDSNKQKKSGHQEAKVICFVLGVLGICS